jgi:hypothetical protein
VSLFKGVPCRYAFQVVQIWSRMADYFRGGQIVGSNTLAAPSLSRLPLVKEGCLFFHKFDAPRHVSDVTEACSRFLARWMVDRMFLHPRHLLLSSAQAAVVVSAAGNYRPAKSKTSLVPAGPLMPHVLTLPLLSRFSQRYPASPRCGYFCAPSLYQPPANSRGRLEAVIGGPLSSYILCKP